MLEPSENREDLEKFIRECERRIPECRIKLENAAREFEQFWKSVAAYPEEVQLETGDLRRSCDRLFKLQQALMKWGRELREAQAQLRQLRARK